jgi:tetratricopeptide (TPR) repeat protein
VRLALGNLAAAHIAQGKLERAQAELIEVLEREKKAGTPELGDFIDTYRLGDVKRLQGDFKSALELQHAALAASQKEHGENDRVTANAHLYLARSLRDSGDAESAEREFRAALTAYPTAEPPFLATVRYELGLLLLERGATRAEGIEMLDATVQLREKYLGADDPKTKQARKALRNAQEFAKS